MCTFPGCGKRGNWTLPAELVDGGAAGPCACRTHVVFLLRCTNLRGNNQPHSRCHRLGGPTGACRQKLEAWQRQLPGGATFSARVWTHVHSV